MSTIVKLVQGNAEWHEHRRHHRNASETPIVLGVSPWCTLYQLWQQKMGLRQPAVNPAMLRGVELEPLARAAYEARTGRIMQPLVLVDGEYSASLDGLTLDGERLLEIKCPFHGSESTLWKELAVGELPRHYRWQVQHQLMVAAAGVADVFVFDGANGQLLEVTPDPAYWLKLRTVWDAFNEFLVKAEPPPLHERDVRVRYDPDWLEAAAQYRGLRAKYDELSATVEEAKAKLLELASHPKEQGGEVCVTRYWKRGSVDYKRVPELAHVDVERFRGPSREEVRVALQG